MALYEKPVRLLMRDMVKDWGLGLGQTFDRERAIEWFKERYPLAKEGTINAHLIRLSTNAPSRLHYRPSPDDNLLYQLGGSTFRLYVLPSEESAAARTRAAAYQEEGITGIEFPAGGRFIDILALDRSGALVVVELKVSRGYDRTVGQLLRYIGWIEANQAEPGQRVRGVIVAKEISEDLLLACRRIQDVALYEYQLSVTLRRVTSSSAPLAEGA